MSVKVIRLLSGEDLVAKVEDHGNEYDYVTLQNPLIIVPSQDPAKPGFGVAYWPFFADRDAATKLGINVKKSTIVVIYDALNDIVNHYNTATGGLIVPTKPALILG